MSFCHIGFCGASTDCMCRIDLVANMHLYKLTLVAFFLIRALKLLLRVTWWRRKYKMFLLCFSCSPSCSASSDCIQNWIVIIIFIEGNYHNNSLSYGWLGGKISKGTTACLKKWEEKIKNFLVTFLISSVKTVTQ
jgi:hypothetical protein